jgi:hypothetical protein
MVTLHQSLRRGDCYGTIVGTAIVFDATLRVEPGAPEMSLGVGAAALLLPPSPEYAMNPFCDEV